MAKGSMREQMPGVAALIDDLRKAFGAAYIDGIIAAGMRGEPVFAASENGHTVGTAPLEGIRVVKDERGTPCILVMPNGDRIKDMGDVGRLPKQERVKRWK